MSNLYFTVVTQRQLYTSTEGDGTPVAEVAFQTDKDITKAASFIFDAVSELGVTKHDSTMLREFGEVFALAALPSWLDIEKPEWSKEDFKLWVIRKPVPT